MNDRSRKNANNRPVTLDNEAAPYAAVFAPTAPVATTATVFAIGPDAHFLS